MDFDIRADKLREECGVFGMYDLDGRDVASTIYYGLFALQHRGQESCGIAVSDTEGPKGQVRAHRGMGLCSEVVNGEVMEKLHNVDMETLTPLEALNFLYELKKMMI